MLFSIVVSLLVLSILVIVHELGHFLAAKKAGLAVEEFGLGYPPRLASIKRQGTVYSLNAVPFGGFVKIDEDALADYPKLVRAGIISSGIIMNLLLAVVAFSLIFGIMGIPQQLGFVEIQEVTAGSPANEAGFQVGDKVIRMANTESRIMNNTDFVEIINENLGQEIAVAIERQGLPLSLAVTPRKEPPAGEGPLGVVISDSRAVQPVWWQRPFLSFWFGLKETGGWLLTILFGVAQIFYRLLFQWVIPQDVTGPVGIVQVTSQAAKHGFLALLQFLGLLSVNLAVLNFLPLPALDGGRLLFIAIEALTGKKPQPRFEKAIHTIGMVILLTLMTAVTIQDIKRVLRPSLF